MKTLFTILTLTLVFSNLSAREGIRWVSLDEAQARQKISPRKVLIFVYADWCHNCQNMETTTFTNEDVVAYINQHFYAVKFNADARDSIRFFGRYYINPKPGDPQSKHQFAVALAAKDGTLGFPTYVYFDESFRRITTPIRGYKDISSIEKDLRFIGEGHYKKTSIDGYSKGFISLFDSGVEAKSFSY